MKGLFFAAFCLFFSTACALSMPSSEYCEMRASALSGSPMATRNLLAVLRRPAGVEFEELTRSSEYALLAKLLIAQVGPSARSLVFLELGQLEDGMVRVLPYEPEIGVCVEGATTAESIDDCMQSIGVWVVADFDNPADCPLK